MPKDSTKVNLNTKSDAQTSYDAIVIGSGISGGWAAKELTEKGLKVLLLERGFDIRHKTDYEETNKAPWEYPHRGSRTQQMIKDYPVLKRDYPLNEINLKWWANEKDSPYTEVKRFDWFRGYHVGGRSLMWGRQSYRWSDFDFDANLKDGVSIDWPIRYKDLAPWYSYVEKFAGINGSKDGLAQLPDGEFQPPMELNCVEKDVAAKIKEKFDGKRILTIGRTANLTKELPGRTLCQYRNKCSNGCPFGGYFSTQSSTLPAAMETGNLTLRINSIVTQILYDKDTKKANGVEVIDAETNQTYTFTAKIIFLNASALNSTWLLMNSATNIWEGGLGSSSGELGHNLMDHHFRIGANATVEGYEDKYYFGRRPNGFYIPRWTNLFGDKRNYLRGFGYQGAASRQGWSREIAELSIGTNLKEALTEPGNWTIGMTGFGEMLPYHDNLVSLDKNIKDKWGLPVLAIDCEIKENELKMREDMRDEAVAMLEAAGLKDVKGFEKDHAPGMGIHEMGTARMGNNSSTSVVNSNCQAHDVKNLFLADSSPFVSQGDKNATWTILALSLRTSEYIIDQRKKANL